MMQGLGCKRRILYIRIGEYLEDAQLLDDVVEASD